MHPKAYGNDVSIFPYISTMSGDNVSVALVERMLELHKRTPKTPIEQEMVTREIRHVDKVIDDLVYELYGLTDEEIKVVEGS